MNTVHKKNIRLRVFILAGFFTLFLTVIGAKAVYLQVIRGPWLSEKAANQYETSYSTQGKRGIIYDREYREMAVSIDATSIAAYPAAVKDTRKTAAVLSKALGIHRKEIRDTLTQKRPFVWIKRQVTPKETEAVQGLKLAGIAFRKEHRRYYPNRSLAAQVIGFSGVDCAGLEGVEYYYEPYLKGDSEEFKGFRDALGRGFAAEKGPVVEPAGKNIVLTIDKTIQYIAERAIEEAVLASSGKSGMALVMVPRTGALLAVAHYPSFNPNAFRKFGREQWRNRAVTDPFEPGSTIKIFSAAAAIEYGGSTSNTIFFCENGAYRIGSDVVHDHTPHGWLSLQQIVKYSSNIGAIKISEMLGAEPLYDTLLAFGFGRKTGIDCPGETSGTLSHYKKWSKIDTGTISFGQGVSVSAIQLITATCAIANGGMLMKPRIVQAVLDQNGKVLETRGPQVVRRVVSAKTAQTVARIMKTVIAPGGTGINAALEGYTVSGKTGTAQKSGKKGTYAKGKYVSSFVGFTPSENPAVAILVVVDEPRADYHGSKVAAPVFKKIALETLNYLNIPPSDGTDRLTVSRGNEAHG